MGIFTISVQNQNTRVMASDNKTHKDNTSKAADGITLNRGPDNLAITDLADDLGIDKGLLNDLLNAEEDHFPPILTDIESDLLALFNKYPAEDLPSETAFVELFKDLYAMLLQKPHYLTILFDERLMTMNKKVGDALIRIRGVAERHLTRLIESGKKAGSFTNGQPSESLAKSIMTSFRSMMKDEHRINEILLELKSPETLID